MIPDFYKYDDYVKMSLDDFDTFDTYVPEEVCHYTKMTTALEKILSTGKIRLGEITSTNDPLESGKRHFNAVWGVPRSDLMFTSYEVELWTQVRKEWRVLCTSCHYDPSSHFMGKVEYESTDDYGYGTSHSRMWAQYGENHSGICLLFDGKKLNDVIHEYYGDKNHVIRHGFVRYNYEKSVEDPLVIDVEFMSASNKIEYMRRCLEKYYKEYFLYKSEEWVSEHEFRWLVRSQDPLEEILVPIETVLKAVVIGDAFSEVYIPSVNVLCDKLKVPVYKITWFDGKPKVQNPSSRKT